MIGTTKRHLFGRFGCCVQYVSILVTRFSGFLMPFLPFDFDRNWENLDWNPSEAGSPCAVWPRLSSKQRLGHRSGSTGGSNMGIKSSRRLTRDADVVDGVGWWLSGYWVKWHVIYSIQNWNFYQSTLVVSRASCHQLSSQNLVGKGYGEHQLQVLESMISGWWFHSSASPFFNMFYCSFVFFQGGLYKPTRCWTSPKSQSCFAVLRPTAIRRAAVRHS